MCFYVFAFKEYATTCPDVSDKVKLMQLAKPTIKASPLITASCVVVCCPLVLNMRYYIEGADVELVGGSEDGVDKKYNH